MSQLRYVRRRTNLSVSAIINRGERLSNDLVRWRVSDTSIQPIKWPYIIMQAHD